MITLKNVTKKFGEKKALDDITFEIVSNGVVGFLGPNGAGKTTTMRIIVGYVTPSSGAVRVDDKDPATQRVDVLETVGYLAENNPLYGDMTVREYLSFIAQVKRVLVWDTYLAILGLTDMLNRRIDELSRGFKQRVGLAAALLGNPKVLILDEPTSGLDPIEQEKIRELIKKLGSEKIIIFSTHILSEVEDVASQVIIINKGKLVYDGEKPKGTGGVEKIFKKLVAE